MQMGLCLIDYLLLELYSNYKVNAQQSNRRCKADLMQKHCIWGL